MTPLVLREYQAAAIEAARERIRAGRRAPLLVSPTGSGKTVMAAAIVHAHLRISATHRVLILVHRRELVQQMAATIRRAGLVVGEIHPDAEGVDTGARVVVAMAQTLLARGGEVPNGTTLVVVDEAHHYAADVWSSLTSACADALLVGFSATPARADGRGLSPPFDSLVVVASIGELTTQGFLVPCKVVAPDRPLRGRELAQSPVDAYVAHARGRRAVVFAEFVADAQRFSDDFRSRGIPAVVVHGELPSDEREEALRAHREDGAVLVNCMVLTEGWDSPDTAVCILARGCGSVGTYLQIVGRVLRPAPGKSEALLIDLSGRAFYAHGAPDEERVFSLTGRAIRRKDGERGLTCFVCGSLVDGWPCGVCGHIPEGQIIEAVRVVGEELAERYATKRAEEPNAQIDTLARWIAEAAARGWNPWSAVRKYTHVYGRAPCPSYVAEAHIRARALACSTCATCGLATVRTYRGGRCGKCAFEKGAA